MLFTRRLPALALGVVVAVLAASAFASGRAAISCAARAGSTLLENGGARVYSANGLVYACARPSGRAYLLRADNPAMPGEVFDEQLVGQFVAWRQIDDHGIGGSTISLRVLSLRNGRSHQVGAVSGSTPATPQESFGDIALNSSGTLVWIVNSNTCGQSCRVTSALYKNSGHGNAVLESTSVVGAPGDATLTPPISSLGLSESGRVAYWMTKGTVHGVAIG